MATKFHVWYNRLFSLEPHFNPNQWMTERDNMTAEERKIEKYKLE